MTEERRSGDETVDKALEQGKVETPSNVEGAEDKAEKLHDTKAKQGPRT